MAGGRGRGEMAGIGEACTRSAIDEGTGGSATTAGAGVGGFDSGCRYGSDVPGECESSETGLEACGEADSDTAGGRGEAVGDCENVLVATGDETAAAGVVDLEL